MSLREEITPDIIANTIYQDTYDGYHILVEGETDCLFYSRFFCRKNSQFFICHGKENVIEAIKIINLRFKKKKLAIGIVDKDYDFLCKSILDYPDNLICTDSHDVEMMCLKSKSFDNISKEYFSSDKIDKLFNSSETNLRYFLLQLIKPISELRIINSKDNLSLSFKSKNNNDKELNYGKIICRNSLKFKGYNDLIDTVKRYRNQAVHLNNEEIIKKIEILNLDEYDIYDVCHGHDLTKVIQIGMKKKLGKNSLSSVTASELERVMRLAYNGADFSLTKLKMRIDEINDKLVTV